LRNSAPIVCGDVRQFLYILYVNSAATGQFRHFTEQGRPIEFLRRSAAITQWVKQADGIKLGICLSRESLDIALIVPTMVVSPVGYELLKAVLRMRIAIMIGLLS
jgi:hypothetical protein